MVGAVLLLLLSWCQLPCRCLLACCVVALPCSPRWRWLVALLSVVNAALTAAVSFECCNAASVGCTPTAVGCGLICCWLGRTLRFGVLATLDGSGNDAGNAAKIDHPNGATCPKLLSSVLLRSCAPANDSTLRTTLWVVLASLP